MNIKTRVWVTITIFSILLLYIIIQFNTPKQKRELTLATGMIGSDSYAYGLSYKALLEEDGVKLNLLPTNGSLDTIGYINNKQADIGFINSGILINKPNYQFESLASAYYEPLWIFYRNDGYKLNYLIETIDKKIGVSITNDGTYDIAKKILEANGIDESNTNFEYLFDKNAINKLKNKELDIFITLASEQNQYINELLADPNIEILSLKRAKAYVQKFDYLDHLLVYEGSLDLYKNIPNFEVDLLSTTQNLVAHKNVSDELIRIFLKKVSEIHSNQNFFKENTIFPSLENLNTQINAEAQFYLTQGDSWLETIFPYWIASNIDRLKILLIPLLWLLIPLSKSIIPLYVFTIRSKIFKWYDRLNELDEEVDNAKTKEEIEDIKRKLQELHDQISQKTKVPLSYMGEYYNLFLHIELIEKKISNKFK